MKKTIAICSNIPIFWNNKILDHELCAQYFGASWMPILGELAKKANYEVISGDIALQKIRKKELLPENIYVVQELNARHAKQLLTLGANPAILTGAESPLFSYYFYDHLKQQSKKFVYKQLFTGAYAFLNQKIDNRNNFPFYFPSFSINDPMFSKPLAQKEFMVMIAANKNGLPPIPNGIKNQITWLIHRIYKFFSPSFKIAQKNELHSKRLDLIKYFGTKKNLSLYGSNWYDSKRFPMQDRKELQTVIQDLNPQFVEEKIETLSNYKFAICFENISFDGYVTEKIFHCLLAGCVPIYIGANDIEKFVPGDTFIDYRKFGTPQKLDTFLASLNDNDIEKLIHNGQQFIRSEAGQRYSYEFFAQDILNKIKSLPHDND